MTPLINKNIFNIYIYENQGEYSIELQKSQCHKFINRKTNYSDVFKYKKLFNFNSYFLISNHLLRIFNENINRYSASYDVSINQENYSLEKKKGRYILSFDKDEGSEIFINHFINEIKKYDALLTPKTELNFITENSIFSVFKKEDDNNYRVNDKSHALLLTKEDAFIVLNCKEKINQNGTINATLSVNKLTFNEYKEMVEEILPKNGLNDYFSLFQKNSIVYTSHFIYPEIINSTNHNVYDSWVSINDFFLLKNKLQSNQSSKPTLKI